MDKVVNPSRVYDDYDPPSYLATEEECDTILIYLPGYKKEQLRVQLTASRILKISGECHISDNKFRRFHKEFQVPTNCDTKGITAKFEGEILYIRQPKMITPAGAPEQLADKGKPTAEAPMPSKPPRPPQPQHRPQAQAQAQAQPRPRPQPQPQPQQPQPQPQPQQPQPQPQQPQPQPQPQQPRDLPQPKQQLQSHDLPRPQPQPQQQTPLSEPQKVVEEMERKGNVKDAVSNEEKGKSLKNDEEDEKDQCKYTPRPKQMVGRRGLFIELTKPENFKRLVVTVLLVLGIGFYTTYMFNSIMGDDKEL